MIKEISIENYKSIQELQIELGRVTVFIGENDSQPYYSWKTSVDHDGKFENYLSNEVNIIVNSLEKNQIKFSHQLIEKSQLEVILADYLRTFNYGYFWINHRGTDRSDSY